MYRLRILVVNKSYRQIGGNTFRKTIHDTPCVSTNSVPKVVDPQISEHFLYVTYTCKNCHSFQILRNILRIYYMIPSNILLLLTFIGSLRTTPLLSWSFLVIVFRSSFNRFSYSLGV